MSTSSNGATDAAVGSPWVMTPPERRGVGGAPTSGGASGGDAVLAAFPGDSEMAARCRAVDWAATPLGPVDTWPAALRTAVRLMLATPVATSLWCGPSYTLLYNDAYRRILGVKHPDALGRSGAAVWNELWPALEPQFARVRSGGAPIYEDEALLRMERLEGGRAEDAWFTYALSALTDDPGDAPGADPRGACLAVYNVAVETTARVRAERAVAVERERLERQTVALAASEARFRTVQDASPNGFTLLRPARDASGAVVDFAIVYINAVNARLVGSTPDAMIGRSMHDVFPGARETGLLAEYVRVFETGVPHQQDVRYRHDGIDGFFAITVVRVGDEIAVTYADITDRARAAAERERLLAETEAARTATDLERRRLATVLEQLPVGVSLAEAPGGRLVVSNPAVRRIWGVATPSEGVARYSADYAGYRPPGAPAAGRRYENHEWPLARALATGEVVIDEVIDVERPDGSRVTVSLSAAPVRDAAGQIVGGVVTSLDVTERERLLAAERAAAGRIRLLQVLAGAFSAAVSPEAVVHVLLEHGLAALGATTGLVLLLSADRTHLRCAGSRGYPPGFAARFDTVALDAALPVAAVTREARAVWVEDADAAARLYPDLMPIYAATGSHATAALPLTDPAGRVFGALAFNFATPRTFDADSRAFKEAVAGHCAQALERARLFAAERAARAEAEEARRAAETANAAKSVFLATMSHELRTPLNAIGGYAELIALGIRGPVTPEQQVDLEKIQRSQRHLLGLINGVLNYARVEAGAVHYELTDVALDEVLSTCEALVAPQMRAKGLTLHHDACDRTLRVRGDAEKLQQVVLNLLSNAVKFTAPGGRVALSCTVDGATVRVTVADTGIGIPPDQLTRVFEPFVQVDARLTRTQEGTGLGLAISRDLARGMGGELTAESVPGVGSTFTFTLPSAA